MLATSVPAWRDPTFITAVTGLFLVFQRIYATWRHRDTVDPTLQMLMDTEAALVRVQEELHHCQEDKVRYKERIWGLLQERKHAPE